MRAASELNEGVAGKAFGKSALRLRGPRRVAQFLTLYCRDVLFVVGLDRVPVALGWQGWPLKELDILNGFPLINGNG
ncbi:MAG: hypothetical protein V7724_18455 [Sediminicola sp.]|tara:strand:- start:6442 stop:6672 length:231 start_codon:yes stop_codon:yes gene_type:complete